MSWRCGKVFSLTSNAPIVSPVVSPNHLNPSQRPQSATKTAAVIPIRPAAERHGIVRPGCWAATDAMSRR